MEEASNLVNTLMGVLSLLLAFLGFLCSTYYSGGWKGAKGFAVKTLIFAICFSNFIISILFISFVGESYMSKLAIIHIPVSYILTGVVCLMMAAGIAITLIALTD